jgi:hypothetical protein
LQHLAAYPPAAVAAMDVGMSTSPSPQELWTELLVDWPVDLVSAGPDPLVPVAFRPFSYRWVSAMQL